MREYLNTILFQCQCFFISEQRLTPGIIRLLVRSPFCFFLCAGVSSEEIDEVLHNFAAVNVSARSFDAAVANKLDLKTCPSHTNTPELHRKKRQFNESLFNEFIQQFQSIQFWLQLLKRLKKQISRQFSGIGYNYQ